MTDQITIHRYQTEEKEKVVKYHLPLDWTILKAKCLDCKNQLLALHPNARREDVFYVWCAKCGFQGLYDKYNSESVEDMMKRRAISLFQKIKYFLKEKNNEND